MTITKICDTAARNEYCIFRYYRGKLLPLDLHILEQITRYVCGIRWHA